MSGIAAVVVTGAPGAGKSATVEALSDILAEAGVEHGALELEQLAWGHPWLPFSDAVPQLRALIRAQRKLGRDLFLIAATTETDEELEQLVATFQGGTVLVVALRARADTVSARVMRREPEQWSGRLELASNARELAVRIPDLRRVDVIIDTEDRQPSDAARLIYDEFAAATPRPMSSARPRGLTEHQHHTPDPRSATVTTSWTSEATATGTYAEVNGLNLYYETHGDGRPMILLHGGLGSGEMFGPILPTLAANHQVIVPDLQGHGRTADIDRPLDIRTMADDIAALIDHLGLEKPDLVGYSLGGGVAFFTAVKYPDKVNRLVMASANIRRDAIPPEMLAQQGQVNAAAAEFMKDTPMYELYHRVAPRPEDFGRLLDKVGASMAKDFDFSDELRAIQVPTMIVCADADMAPPSHYVEAFKLLDGGLRDGGWMGEGRPKGGHALAILPGLTHYNLGASPLFAAVTLDFLDQQQNEG